MKRRRDDVFAATLALKAREMLMSPAMAKGIGYRRGDEKGRNERRIHRSPQVICVRWRQKEGAR
eukprot:10668061-Lingulodinium_polyedra.AAC.1